MYLLVTDLAHIEISHGERIYTLEIDNRHKPELPLAPPIIKHVQLHLCSTSPAPTLQKRKLRPKDGMTFSVSYSNFLLLVHLSFASTNFYGVPPLLDFEETCPLFWGHLKSGWRTERVHRL